MLVKAYSDSSSPKTTVKNWFNEFQHGHMSVFREVTFRKRLPQKKHDRNPRSLIDRVLIEGAQDN